RYDAGPPFDGSAASQSRAWAWLGGEMRGRALAFSQTPLPSTCSAAPLPSAFSSPAWNSYPVPRQPGLKPGRQAEQRAGYSWSGLLERGTVSGYRLNRRLSIRGVTWTVRPIQISYAND